MKYWTTAIVFVAGCGSTALPPAKVTEAQSAVSAAEAVGAANHPRAALHLKLANDQLEQAEGLMREDEHDKARLVLDSARADAELALLMTRSAQERAKAEQALRQVSELR